MENKNTCRKCKHFVVDDKVNGVGHCSKNNVVMFSTRNACKDYDDNIDNIKERAIRFHDDAIDALRYYMNKPGNLKILPIDGEIDKIENRRMVPMDNKGDSVLRMVRGMPANKVWPVIDEVMETIKAFQPRLYQAALTKLKD